MTITAFRLISDLHRDANAQEEFDISSMKNVVWLDEDAPNEVLLVPGDFMNCAFQGCRSRLYREFDQHVTPFKKVLYCLGNHEHYGGYPIKETIKELKEKYTRDSHITLLDNESYVFEEEKISVFGGTMWAGFEIESREMVRHYIAQGINDFRSIKVAKNVPWNITHCIMQYRDYVDRLEAFLERVPSDHKVVVMSHFGPFLDSIHWKYLGNTFNAYFTNDLKLREDLHKKISVWVHGHTHESMKYVNKGIRVYCNPCGYPTERETNGFDPGLRIQL